MTMTARLLACALAFAALPPGSVVAGEVAAGSKIYRTFCSHCHGAKMVNPGNSSFDLRKFSETDEERFRTSLTKGKGAMPPFGKKLKPEEIDNLWAYILTDGKD
ncbi:cytochrome c [Mesorhizobium sp. DCY119]|uniref:c-type cytochrome n=2 Tax=Mesorhizobium sp. DCY119 TaxID=2108445 RepID=UPI001058AC64|nr:cytochrome c [Mesorhizobium sp. DCY119]